LNNKVQKGQYAIRHNKNREEYDFDKNYQECTYTPQINVEGSHLKQPDQTLSQIKGTQKIVERMQAGRQQNIARKAAQEDRFGIVKQEKSGEKVAVNKDEGLTSVR
jgi:hypothetical protein